MPQETEVMKKCVAELMQRFAARSSDLLTDPCLLGTPHPVATISEKRANLHSCEHLGPLCPPNMRGFRQLRAKLCFLSETACTAKP